jgi:surface polysaccharide O-acyltransferase-like enzyme
VLLAFGLVAAALFLVFPKWGEALGGVTAGASQRPALFFALLVAVSALAYIPMELKFNGFAWASWGPFVFQTSRILHYFVYFMVGAGVGAFGIGEGLLAGDGDLSRRWVLWAVTALVAFSVESMVGIAALSPHASPRLWEVAADCGFVLSCAASSFAYLALFVRFARSGSKVWDSLTANAYGIYLVHYAFVSWLQYSLLKATLLGIAKGSLVILGALARSWGTIAALRRIPAVARVI